MARYLKYFVALAFPSVLLAQTEVTPESATSQSSDPSLPRPGAFFIWPEPAKLEGPLATDRPGFSDSAFLVPRGHAQLELGYTYLHDHEDHTETKTHVSGITSLRVGLFDDFEFRVKWGGYSTVDSWFRDVSPGGRPYVNHQHDDGATDMSVGFKAPILKHTDANHLPNISMIPSLSLPTGTDTKTSGDVDPTFELAWNYPVTQKLTIYGVGSIASISDADGRFPQATASFAGSYSLTDKFSWFAEYFGIFPNTRHSDCAHGLNAGPVYLITDNIQLDVYVGMGLNEEAPDFSANIGLSIRL